MQGEEGKSNYKEQEQTFGGDCVTILVVVMVLWVYTSIKTQCKYIYGLLYNNYAGIKLKEKHKQDKNVKQGLYLYKTRF